MNQVIDEQIALSDPPRLFYEQCQRVRTALRLACETAMQVTAQTSFGPTSPRHSTMRMLKANWPLPANSASPARGTPREARFDDQCQ
jgi:hypothetical protein